MAIRQTRDIRGFALHEGHLDRKAQEAVAAAVHAVAEAAPFVRPVTRRGQALSVRMTSCGDLGWTSDRRGYRYEPRHPSGAAWPPIPPEIRAVWDAVVPGRPPARELPGELVRARSPHGDASGPRRGGPGSASRVGLPGRRRAVSGWATSRAAGEPKASGCARGTSWSWVAWHGWSITGVDRIAPGTSDLLGVPGRINLTLRVVT